MDNNTRLENIMNKALEAAEEIVTGEVWSVSMDGLSVLEGLMNVALIANELKSSQGSTVNAALEGAFPMPDFGGVMPR